MSYATSGVGSQQHMTAEWFAKLAGIKLEHVPYRGGGQAINDLVAGHITLASLGSTPLIPHYKAGTLKLLAQSTAERSPSLPDVPTYQEAGVKLVLDQWLGVFVPAGTPPAIAARLNTEMNKALRDACGARRVRQFGAGAGRRHARAVRQAGARGFRQIRAADERAEHQGRLMPPSG